MPQNFLSCDRDQALLLSPDLRDWLDEDHLAWFVIEAIQELDLDTFYVSYRSDGHGRSAHDPKMMLTLLAYAYSVGERSSRGIERRCREDVAFRVICANQVPDHATIARFRVRHERALGDLFSQVLGLCAQAGLVEVGVIAVDGSKFAAMASDKATRSYEQIAAEVLAEAGRIDAAEDEIHGEARGDELPEHLARREGRRAWLREAKQRLDAERAEREESIPKAREQRLELCRRRLVEEWQTERQAHRDYEAYRRRGVRERGKQAMGSPPKPVELAPAPTGKINTSDPDAKRMKSGRDFIPAYNTQAVTTEGQIIVAAEITTEGVDFEQLEPMISTAERELKQAGVTKRPEVVLADAGYWSNGHIDALRERGMTPIVAPDTTRNRPRKTRLGGPYDFMRRAIATERGGDLYSRRKWMVEPVFAQIKANRGIDRSRGLPRAQPARRSHQPPTRRPNRRFCSQAGQRAANCQWPPAPAGRLASHAAANLHLDRAAGQQLRRQVGHGPSRARRLEDDHGCVRPTRAARGSPPRDEL
ncbi:MAG TPA: transposase [Solirubrobacterales bacterium]|jgi:transposase